MGYEQPQGTPPKQQAINVRTPTGHVSAAPGTEGEKTVNSKLDLIIAMLSKEEGGDDADQR